MDKATLSRAAARGERVRQYIGASGIGTDCLAYQALSLRGFPSVAPDAQLQRIFDRGHIVEEEVVQLMKLAGYALQELDPASGEQWEFTTYGDHVVVHLDGRLTEDGVAMTFECKSMNRDFFKRLVSKGVRISHPHYYDQAVMGMGLSGIGRCMFVAYCKDNSTHHVEYIDADPERYQALLTRAANAMFAEPKRRSAVADYECKQCFKYDACWKNVAGAEVISRTDCSACAEARPDVAKAGKQWWCTKHNQPAAHKCGDYRQFKVVPIQAAS